MKKYLAITAALALVLTACGHAAPDIGCIFYLHTQRIFQFCNHRKQP